MELEKQKSEVAEKRQRIVAFLERNGLDGLALSRQGNFSWATGGSSNWVSTASETGVATVLFRKDGSSYVVLNNMEAPRLADEENLKESGFEMVPAPWWEGGAPREKLLLDMIGGAGKKLGVDFGFASDQAQDVTGLIAQERYNLTPEECDRYRQVGALAADALEGVVANLTPGLTEWEIAGQLAQAAFRQGLVPFVTLVAVDERIFKYRHPIPTMKKLDKYAMVVLCAKGGGLVANCTRLIHFGPLSQELREKQAACQRVDAVYNLSTKPGVAVRDVFTRAQQEYAANGYPDEWQLHHQGGGTGYESRDFLGTPTATETVQPRQAFAWNPSITGIKTEDTVLVSENGPEVLTRSANSSWPVDTVTIEGLGTMQRPAVLVKE